MCQVYSVTYATGLYPPPAPLLRREGRIDNSNSLYPSVFPLFAKEGLGEFVIEKHTLRTDTNQCLSVKYDFSIHKRSDEFKEIRINDMELINCLKHIFLELGFIVFVIVFIFSIYSLSSKGKNFLFKIRHNTRRKKKGYLKK